jgi:hypothetical protein
MVLFLTFFNSFSGKCEKISKFYNSGEFARWEIPTNVLLMTEWQMANDVSVDVTPFKLL